MSILRSFEVERLNFSPPLTPPFKHRGGVSSFGVRRWRSSSLTNFTRDLPSVHEGVDLVPALSNDEGEVYGAYWGTIAEHNENRDTSGNIIDEDIGIRCEPMSVGIFVRYLHIIRTKTLSNGLTVTTASLNVGDNVRPGQLLGYISPNNPDPHLHYELRALTDPNQVIAPGRPVESFSIDPTSLLYRFDVGRWPRARNKQIDDWSFEKYHRISRLRIVPWVVEHQPGQVKWHTQKLLQVLIEDDNLRIASTNTGAHQQNRFYLPIDVATPTERIMIDTLREAFLNSANIRLRGRVSYFFNERLMIEDISLRPA
jgi:hypothetical protein